MRFLTLFSVLLLFSLSELSAADNNAELGEISSITNEVEIVHSFSTGEGRVQIGSKVYADDVVKTGKNSAVEITCGINVRLRLGENGEMVFHPAQETTKNVDEVRTTTRLYAVLLRFGTLRARIRENVVNATPVVLKAGEVRFYLPRADFLLQRAPGDPSAKKMLDCLLAWGKVELYLHDGGTKAGDSGKNGEDLVNYQPGRALVSEIPADNTPPPWQPLPYDEAKKLIREKAPFSVDKTPELPQENPQANPELKGA